MSGYVSPIPTEERGVYHSVMRREIDVRRRHMFPQADGSQLACDPRVCRECYREANWKEGQARG